MDQKQILNLFAQVVQSQLDAHKALTQLRYALRLQHIVENLKTPEAEKMLETAYAELDERTESSLESIRNLLKGIRGITEEVVNAE